MDRVLGKKWGITYFLPLLVLYVVLIISFSPDALIGDENRYVGYANNLANGFYTNPDNPDLSNGPSYPLVLLPFVALNIDFLAPKLLNGVFVFMGVFFFYRTLLLYTKQKYALFAAIILGLYPPLLRWMPRLYSESLAFMCMCGFIFYCCLLYNEKRKNWKSYVPASLFLAFLVLTKVVFFHVMVVSAVLLVVLYLIKSKLYPRKALLVLIGATIFISPYIIYAYSVTGKLFYLGTRGGEILYHRSTPFENEWGNWFSGDNILGRNTENNEAIKVYQSFDSLSANHRDLYLELEPLSNIERDSAFKAKAFANMKAYPLKYLKNTVANAGRLLFNYPISYRSQDLNSYGYIIPNMFIVVLFLLIIYPAFLARKRIPFEIKAQLMFAFIYAGGMILLGGKGRYFIVIVPSLVLFFVYVCTTILKINLAEPIEES